MIQFIKFLVKALLSIIGIIVLTVCIIAGIRTTRRNNQMEYHELTRIVKMAEWNETLPNGTVICCPACGDEFVKKNGYCFCDANCASRFYDMKMCWEHRTKSMTGGYE